MLGIHEAKKERERKINYKWIHGEHIKSKIFSSWYKNKVCNESACRLIWYDLRRNKFSVEFSCINLLVPRLIVSQLKFEFHHRLMEPRKLPSNSWNVQKLFNDAKQWKRKIIQRRRNKIRISNPSRDEAVEVDEKKSVEDESWIWLHFNQIEFTRR